MVRVPALSWAAVVFLTAATPGTSAIIGYDDKGAFLGVQEDVYVGGKWSTHPTIQSPATLRTFPATSGLPPIDPMIFVAIAIVLAILLLESSDSDTPLVSDVFVNDATSGWLTPMGTPDLGTVSTPLPAPPTDGVVRRAPRQPDQPPIAVAPVPLPHTLPLLVLGLLILLSRRGRR